MKNKLFLGVVLVVIAVIATGSILAVRDNTFGSVGPNNLDPQIFYAGVTYANYYSTSTSATSQTLIAQDLVAPTGSAYDTIAMTPTVGDVTFTLPASSTLRHFLPQAGMSAKQCWLNASTTSGIDITFAAGTGIDLEIASSTTAGGAVPALTILSNSKGCFEFTRKPSTATTFDFNVSFLRFVDGD